MLVFPIVMKEPISYL